MQTIEEIQEIEKKQEYLQDEVNYQKKQIEVLLKEQDHHVKMKRYLRLKESKLKNKNQELINKIKKHLQSKDD